MSSSGTVIFFNLKKGFGFIQPEDDGESLFVHVTRIVDGKVPQDGDICYFDIEYDDRKGKCHAVNVTGGSGVPISPPEPRRTLPAFDPSIQVYAKMNRQIMDAAKDKRQLLALLNDLSTKRVNLNKLGKDYLLCPSNPDSGLKTE